jgi:DNA-binding MarR family transcriptional regulator
MPDRAPLRLNDEVVVAPDLREPRSILDLVNYQMYMIESSSASAVTRMCEGEFGITRREWRFVSLLAAVGPMAPSELATRAGLDRSRTSKALMALLAKHLIERRSLAGDRRRAVVRLTADGDALHARLFPRVKEINALLLSVLSEEELQTLQRVLPVLRNQAIAIANSNVVEALADRRHGGSLKIWKSGGK